jgi:hypothetical protein
MLVAIALAFLVDAPTPAPSLTPLREVVFKCSSLRREALTIETYGGQVANPSGQSNDPVLFEPQPTSKVNATLQDGTLTVDVIGIQQDVIKVRVTEEFKNRPAPLTYEAYVAPNGLVRFDAAEPSPIARYVLPLFGTKFAASTTLSSGDSWHVDLQTNAVNVQNIFTITGQDGPLLLLQELETVRLSSAHGMNVNVRGKLRYKPSMLVPISGDIDERGNRGTMDSTDEATTTVHFERMSDTLDQTMTATK